MQFIITRRCSCAFRTPLSPVPVRYPPHHSIPSHPTVATCLSPHQLGVSPTSISVSSNGSTHRISSENRQMAVCRAAPQDGSTRNLRLINRQNGSTECSLAIPSPPRCTALQSRKDGSTQVVTSLRRHARGAFERFSVTECHCVAEHPYLDMNRLCVIRLDEIPQCDRRTAAPNRELAHPVPRLFITNLGGEMVFYNRSVFTIKR